MCWDPRSGGTRQATTTQLEWQTPTWLEKRQTQDRAGGVGDCGLCRLWTGPELTRQARKSTDCGRRVENDLVGNPEVPAIEVDPAILGFESTRVHMRCDNEVFSTQLSRTVPAYPRDVVRRGSFWRVGREFPTVFKLRMTVINRMKTISRNAKTAGHSTDCA